MHPFLPSLISQLAFTRCCTPFSQVGTTENSIVHLDAHAQEKLTLIDGHGGWT